MSLVVCVPQLLSRESTVLTRCLRSFLFLELCLCRYIFVLRLAGSGPFWKETFTNDIKLCSTGWWTNLL